jgi:iron complex transport system substrate-binding protein
VARFRVGTCQVPKAKSWFPLALLAISLSACSGTHEQGAASTASGSAFPVKILAADGTVTIPREPRRIVSLSASATEDLYAIGAGPQVVAVDAYSTYPPEAPRTQLSEASPDLEAIAKYRPDLVVIAEDNDHIVSQLQKLRIPVLFEPPPSNLGNAYQEITQLGQATGRASGVLPVVSDMKRRIAAVVRSVPRPSRPLRIYHELEPNYYSATSHTFIGQIYSLLGLENIADQAHAAGVYPQLSAEYIVASNPDLIVLADTVCCKQSAATVAARPGWGNIAAVKNGAVLGVEDAIASQWGPRIVLFVEKVARAVKELEAKSR